MHNLGNPEGGRFCVEAQGHITADQFNRCLGQSQWSNRLNRFLNHNRCKNCDRKLRKNQLTFPCLPSPF